MSDKKNYRKKRTNVDFSKHEFNTDVFTNAKGEEINVFELKKPDTNCGRITYVNAKGTLTVSGDYGNWVFCREFHPSADEHVSDHYWIEKLKIYSTQVPGEYSSEDTKAEILGKIEELKAEDHNDEDEIIKYYNDCLDYVGEEWEYTKFAYDEVPNGYDHEWVIFNKRLSPQLEIVFDWFEEMCDRIDKLLP